MTHTQYPALFHITHWKSGSQWIYAILQSLFPEDIVEPEPGSTHFTEQPVQAGKIYPTVYLAKDVFDSVDKPDNYQTFFVMRDLRDTFVSWYFSLMKSHGTESKKGTMTKIIRTRNKLVDKPVSDGLEHVFKTVGRQAARIQESWMDTDVPVIRYEDLLRHEYETFAQIIELSGRPVDDEKLRAVVQRHSFQNVTGRKRGEEDTSSHHRKGISGDWKNYFTPELTEMFKEIYGDVLIKTGYEENSDW